MSRRCLALGASQEVTGRRPVMCCFPACLGPISFFLGMEATLSPMEGISLCTCLSSSPRKCHQTSSEGPWGPARVLGGRESTGHGGNKRHRPEASSQQTSRGLSLLILTDKHCHLWSLAAACAHSSMPRQERRFQAHLQTPCMHS